MNLSNVSDASASGSDRSTPPLPPLPVIAPLQNPKYRHISRSAAKRESVQMLGSIKDLQLHFARAGLAEHHPGSGVGVKGLGGIDEGKDNDENLPPRASSSSSSFRHERRAWKEVNLPKVDPESVRREARGTVGRIRNLWGLGGGSSISMAMGLSPSCSTTNFASGSTGTPTTPSRNRKRGTKVTLVDTAKAIRRVRDLAMIVSDGPGNRRVSSSSLLVPKSGRNRSGFSTPSRPSGGMPRAVSMGATRPPTTSLREEIKEDGLGELRKAALEVLSGLRALEETLRIVETRQEPSSPSRPFSLGVESDVSAVNTDSNRPTSTFTGTDGYDSDEEEYSFNAENQETQEQYGKTWEERIEDESREYRALEEEEERVDGVRDSVKKWLGIVEGLFGVEAGTAGELEQWARENWDGRSLERLHAFLLSHLPHNLQALLPSSTSGDFEPVLLARLSDGYILAQACNSAILYSTRVWGVIPPEDIHDTLRLGEEGEEKADKEWTFRRVGNLTCWAATLRNRYKLPIHMPTSSHTLAVPLILPPKPASPSPNPSPSVSPVPGVRTPPKRKDMAPRIDFDPLVVAKKGEGWEESLRVVVERWVEEAAREARESQSDAGETTN